MKRRTLVFLSLLIFCIGFSIVRLFLLSTKDSLQTVALQNSSYNLKICSNRGNIYDCRKEPLLESKKTNILVVVPDIKTPSLLSKFLSPNQMNEVLPKLGKGKPFCVDINDNFVSCEGMSTFKISKRLNEVNLAPHIIGYLDNTGNGVCGIEKSFNDYLNNTKGVLNIRYKVDALGRLLPNNNVLIEDNTKKQTGGVVLNIDKRLQEISQLVAEKYMKKGAIIITEVPNCEIRACVSMPKFSTNNISECLNDESLPLLNRAFMAYNVGSVFKLVTAAKALEQKPDIDYYNCNGDIEIDKAHFHCYDNKAHGHINIIDALAFSCNTFFVNLSKTFDPQDFLNFIDKLGFGRSEKLAPDLMTSKGNIPKVSDLKQSRYMSNLSFGQGTLMVTPLQVSGLINTIASDGIYSNPKLVKGLVNENMDFVKTFDEGIFEPVFSKGTAKILKEGMRQAIEKGTGQRVKPFKCNAALKTGTAQTGIRCVDKMILQGWCAGFFPFEKPKYSIVVFVEDAEGGSQSCGPIFKKIIDEIYNDLYYEFK